jgi:hypothetical protein
MRIKPKEGIQLTGGEAKLEVEYSQLYNPLSKDVMGDEDEDEDFQPNKDNNASDDSKDPAYILFDFRQGIQAWPTNAELIDNEVAESSIEKATLEAEERAKLKKKDNEEEKKDGAPGVSAASTTYSMSSGGKGKTTKYEEPKTEVKIHPETLFETLKDGTTALIVKPGFR